MNEIIEIKQLPVIAEQLQTVKKDITERTEKAMSLVCTEDTLSVVKKERASLTKEFASWEEKRKTVKSKIMSPYEQFEQIYKDCVTNVFKTADAELKKKIDTVEQELKTQKCKDVKDYFDEYLKSKDIDFLTFDRANIVITLSASVKSLKAQAKEFIDKVCDDLGLIDTQEYKDEILYEYKNHLNVSLAIKTVLNRHEELEAERAKAEERKAQEEAKQKAVDKVAEAVPVEIKAPVEEEKIMTVRFTVKGTIPQLKALKEFLNNGGYDYE